MFALGYLVWTVEYLVPYALGCMCSTEPVPIPWYVHLHHN